MATVYLAQDLKHDRPVALKVLHPELAATLGPERFLREVQLTARLQHPHILPLHDSGVADGFLYYVMPYFEGETLRDLIQREKQLPLADALQIAREVADALSYAHAHDVLHRDIKPANILLSGEHAVVADFGIAKAISAADEDALTGTGIAVGTPEYMSPEQGSGDHGVDRRSDIYALGCVLYEMLAGQPPFTGRTAQSILARHRHDTPSSLRVIRPALPLEIEKVVETALAKVPADRWANAQQFAEALAAASISGPVRVVGTSAAEVPTLAPRPRRGRRWALVGTGSLVLLLGIGLAVRGLSTGHHPGTAGPKVLAVLPFENLGLPEDEYFADGMTDAVRGKLSAFPGLLVIARSSSSSYKQTPKPPQQIARELGVQYLLTGTVRWDKGTGESSRVEVSPELVQLAPGGAPVTKWQQPFNGSLTDVFQVQADIASRVAQALNVALGEGVLQELAEKPTQNLAAYDAYLKGVEAFGLGNNTVTLRQAVGAFEQAVALDSTFAVAWARLSQAASLLNVVTTPSSALAEESLTAAQRALALAPDLPDGHAALGDYYRRVGRDNARALSEYAAGQRQGSPAADLLRGTAFSELALGDFQSALDHLRQAETLDPRSIVVAAALPTTLLYLRRHSEALAAADRALALSPGNLQNFENKIMILLSQGDTTTARALIRDAPKEIGPADLVAHLASYYDLFWLLDEQHQAVLLRLTAGQFDGDRGSWGLALAGTYAQRGDRARARLYADSARIGFEQQLRYNPDDAQLHVLLGTALAYLGRKGDAIGEGLKAAELLPIAKDALNGTFLQHQLARIYILLGEPEKALDQLEPLLTIPYYLSPGWLKIDPTFAPLRGNPRFERLLQGKT